MTEAPLRGIRVLEIGNYMASPFCAMQLADLGADVIKIENPQGGDVVRQLGPFVDGESSPFIRLNRNKRSLALDLKTEEGRAIFRKLAARADIIVENLRPGTMRGLGLDDASLRPDNPRLIYIAASGWGQDGPLKEQPGLDIMAQARSGLMSITGMPGGDPVKVGVPVCDLVCALYGALAAVAALHERDRTGLGQFIDVSLLESGVSFAIWEAGKYFATGEIPRALGSAHQTNAPYQAIRSKDGWLTVGAATEKLWIAFCQALELQSLLTDPRYGDMNRRWQNRESLIATIEASTMTQPTSHWLSVLTSAGVPCAPIEDYGQVFNDPHLLARDYYWDAPHPTLGPVRQLGSPMRLSRTPLVRDRAGPLLGEDSAAILAELGYGPDAIDNLRKQNVIATPEALSSESRSPHAENFPPPSPGEGRVGAR
jgi:crotonobetainyl-CoA:carnitine CoA-transferase CaiB-like acyl-CoA transferase